MAILNFDATNIEPSAAPGILPAGRYLVEITASETKRTKSGSGTYLELEMTVIDGEYKGRKIWDRLCLQHSNAKTEQIARANLSAICHAVDVLQPQDSVDLHGLPFIASVRIRKNEATEELNNEIRGYSKRERQTAAARTSSGNTESAPWAR